MSHKIETSGGGIGFFGMLAIVFIALKLANVIDWPWIWVLSPLWIPVALVILIILIVLTVATIASAFEGKEDE